MAKSRVPQGAPVEDPAEAAIADSVVILRQCQSKARTMLEKAEKDGGAYDNRLASHLVWLARELGKVIDRERKRLDHLTVSAILARVRQMDKNEREHVAREIKRMSEGGRLFG